MTNLDYLSDQVSSVERYLTLLDRYRTVTRSQLDTDPTLRGAVERYLYLVAQSTIDLAESFIAYRGYRKPTGYREIFEILEEQGVLEPTFAARLKAMTGFRNVLAHDYVALNLDTAIRVLTHDRVDIEAFLAVIQRELTGAER